MINALFYLSCCTLQNLFIARMRRLRQPKYLIGAVLGGAYFYYFFFRVMWGNKGNPATIVQESGNMSMGELGLVLCIGLYAVLAWVIPRGRAALDFSETEVSFLFTAPLRRSTLIVYKLIKSQMKTLLGAIIMAFVFRHSLSGNFWTLLLAIWVVMITLDLHQMSASFSLTILRERGILTWTRYIIILGAACGCVALAGWWIIANHPIPALGDVNPMADLIKYVISVASSGPVHYALMPFDLLIRPVFAPNLTAFAWSFPWALALMLLHYLWVIQSDVAFEEATIARAQLRAKALAAVHQGNWHLAGAQKKNHVPFQLKSIGWPPMAILWKNLIAASSLFSTPFLIILSAAVIGGVVVIKLFFSQTEVSRISVTLSTFFAPMLLLMGPHALRLDVRQDLPLIEVMKTYPIPGRHFILGEVLAPTVILTLIEYFFILLAILFFQPPGPGNMGTSIFIGYCFAAVFAIPTLSLFSNLTINAITLLFPAWSKLGHGGSQGFEATGQQILLSMLQVVFLGLALVLPAGLAAVILYFGRSYIMAAVLWPLATLAASLLLLGESVLVIAILGRYYDRTDLTKEILV